MDILSFFSDLEAPAGVGFLEGFVVIDSPVELDITAVYTARPTNGEVSTMDVVTITPRKVRRAVTVEPTPLAALNIASSRGQLRISVTGLDWKVRSTALSVFNLQGQAVYTSGPTEGDVLNWRLATTNGPLVANGVYLAVITAIGKQAELVTTIRKFVISR